MEAPGDAADGRYAALDGCATDDLGSDANDSSNAKSLRGGAAEVALQDLDEQTGQLGNATQGDASTENLPVGANSKDGDLTGGKEQAQPEELTLEGALARLAARGVKQDDPALAAPDLHSMGKLLLGPSGLLVFDFAVMLHFVSILISYSLAGSIAYAQLFGLKQFQYLIVPYVVLYTSALIFGESIIQPAISVLTLAKCSLLIFAIGVVGIVAGRVDVQPSSDWAALLEPFLIGTVALGGVVNILPVIYEKLPPTPEAISLFRWGVTTGVLVCWILNVTWAAFVLKIVP